MAEYLGDRISEWDTSSMTSMHRAFAESYINSDVSQWNTHRVRDMSYMFQGTKKFDSNLGSWDTSSATSLRGAFDSAASFRGVGLSNWNVAEVTDFRDAFRNTTSISNCTKRGIRNRFFANRNFFEEYGTDHPDLPGYLARCSDGDMDATYIHFEGSHDNVLETKENRVRIDIHLSSASMNISSDDISIVGNGHVENVTRVSSTVVSFFVRLSLHSKDMSVWINVVSKNDRFASNTLTLRYVGTRPTVRILSASVQYGTRTKLEEIPLSFVASKLVKNFSASDLISSVPSDSFENFHATEHDSRIYSAALRLDTNVTGPRSVYVNESVFTDFYDNLNLASEIFKFEVDRDRPTMQIDSPDMRGDLADDPHYTMLQTFEILFQTDDHTIHSFNLSDVNRSSTVFDVVNLSRIDSHTFRAFVVQDSSALNSIHSIHVGEESFGDEAGWLGEHSNVFSWMYLEPDDFNITNQGVLHSVVATPTLQFDFDREIIRDSANITISSGENMTRLPMYGSGSLLNNFTLDNWTFVNEATYQIGVEIEDVPGNQAKVPNVYTYTYDITPPEITLRSVTQNTTNFTIGAMNLGFLY